MLDYFWKLFSEHVLSPRVSPVELEARLRRAQSTLPKPVIWLLGKTQSGKTSIVRAITGSTQPEIGNGFRPCTRTAQMYSFPSDEECLIRFLDTRGLGETNYDPGDDLAFCQGQAHLLMVVLRGMDHAHATLREAVRAIRVAKPHAPVILVQTALHDGYPFGSEHPQTYPFDMDSSSSKTDPWLSSIPSDLGRSLQLQRKEFAGLANRFVAVDFTLPGDGYSPELYGLESLWSAIEGELPLGLRAILREQPDLQADLAALHYRAAWQHIVSCSIAAGAAAAVPMPLFNIPTVLAVDAKMFHSIASIYGQPLTAQVMGELGAAIGTGFLARLAGRSLVAMIPFVGTAAVALYTAATTYALGCTLCWRFSQVRDGKTPSPDKLRSIFADEMKQGRRRFEEYLATRGQPPAPPTTASPEVA